MTRSLVACLALSTLAAIAAFVSCLASGGGLLAALGLYVATGAICTLLLTGILAASRAPVPAAAPQRTEAPACA